jgi:hypothetical protein
MFFLRETWPFPYVFGLYFSNLKLKCLAQLFLSPITLRLASRHAISGTKMSSLASLASERD